MLCIMHYTVCYITGIFYAVVRQISMLFIDNKISVFCIYLTYPRSILRAHWVVLVHTQDRKDE